jgi:ubiquinone/menaquinone biosynthesis C-methylase UbiE
MKINIGSGTEKVPGFFACDYDPASGADYIFDIGKDVWPFPDNSVDEVWAHHIFEHLGGDSYFHCLKELYRVCKDGTEIDVIVPHHRSDYFYDDPTHVRPITIKGLRMLGSDFNNECIARGEATSRVGNFMGFDFNVSKYRYILNEDWRHLEQHPAELRHAMFKFNNVIDMLHAIMTVRK